MNQKNVETRKKDWVRIAFFMLSPVIGIAGTALYSWKYGIRWWEPTLFLVLYAFVGLSVTAGYHRLFAHKSYECHPLVQAFYLFFGAMALQNSILAWGSDHRIHHRYVDHDWDPYNIQRGGLWAHILWIFYKGPADRKYDDVPDLQKNPLVQFQHKHAAWFGILGGLGIPTLIGWAMGSALGGLLWGGFLRVVVIHHTTFFVNSIAHMYGSRPYTEANSARDNPWVAILTNGEGYHNFHHRFPADFRNGIRWYQWDPSKWWIRGLRVDRAREAAAPDAAARDRALAPADGRGPRRGAGRARPCTTRSARSSTPRTTRSSGRPRSGTSSRKRAAATGRNSASTSPRRAASGARRSGCSASRPKGRRRPGPTGPPSRRAARPRGRPPEIPPPARSAARA